MATTALRPQTSGTVVGVDEIVATERRSGPTQAARVTGESAAELAESTSGATTRSAADRRVCWALGSTRAHQGGVEAHLQGARKLQVEPSDGDGLSHGHERQQRRRQRDFPARPPLPDEEAPRRQLDLAAQPRGDEDDKAGVDPQRETVRGREEEEGGCRGAAADVAARASAVSARDRRKGSFDARGQEDAARGRHDREALSACGVPARTPRGRQPGRGRWRALEHVELAMLAHGGRERAREVHRGREPTEGRQREARAAPDEPGCSLAQAPACGRARVTLLSSTIGQERGLEPPSRAPPGERRR